MHIGPLWVLLGKFYSIFDKEKVTNFLTHDKLSQHTM